MVKNQIRVKTKKIKSQKYLKNIYQNHFQRKIK